MAIPNEHTHHIKIRSTQMEMPTGGTAREEDIDRKLKDAQAEIGRMQDQAKEFARLRAELEEFSSRKHAFLDHQTELTEKLSSSLTMIDRELVEMRRECEELEQCRVAFAAHLAKIDKYNPENWTGENQSEKLERASMALDVAADEYDQAATYFNNSRSAAIFGKPSKHGRKGQRQSSHSEFMVNLRNGFAFNLPIAVLGSLALLIYLTK